MTGAVCRGVTAVWLALAIPGAQPAAAQPVPSIHDDEGRPALMGTPAVRVVTLAPSLTELVFAAGAEDKLVAVSAHSDFPPAAKQLPVVADATGIAWEALLALQPDLVIAWKGGTRPADIARLNALKINVFVLDIRRLADVPRGLRAVGRLVGRPLPAEQAARLFEREVDKIAAANAGKRPLRTFFEVSARPLMTVNRNHVISEVMALCGGRNVFGDASTQVSEPSREALLERNPDAILYGQSGQAAGTARHDDAARYSGMSALRAAHIYGISADHILRPGPRLLLAAAEVCQALDRARSGK